MPVGRYRFVTVDVFTDRRFSGNPLVVVPDARGLATAEMAAVAREFNLSETVFVLPPDDPRHTRRLRIFTPGAELPFAGHPTVGTAWALAFLGDVPLTGERTPLVFEEGVGPVPVTVFGEAGRPVASELTAPRLPEPGPPAPPAADVARVLSLQPDDLAPSPDAPEGWSCGVPFLFVALRDRAAVSRARLDPLAFERVLGTYWARQVFLFARDPGAAGVDLHARMFAPALGVAEDPATGSAVSALAGYLARRDPEREGTKRWVVAQGVEMGRPSRLVLEVDRRGGEIVSVRVGGPSVFVSEGTIEV